jgi:uracil-DNA glycosylase family protein
MRDGKARPSPVAEPRSRRLTLDLLREQARSCTACDLYKRATQTVFGEGKPSARIVLVGEQPGNEEDLSGRPFVGPAGRLLDEAMAKADMDRREVYITNIVKNFKWKDEEGGKRRIHERPRQDEVEACRPWFDKELWIVKAEVLVCLGVTAANAVMGRAVTIRSVRGRALVSSYGLPTFVTVHPSAILRMPDRAVRQAEMRRFVADLRRAKRALPER